MDMGTCTGQGGPAVWGEQGDMQAAGTVAAGQGVDLQAGTGGRDQVADPLGLRGEGEDPSSFGVW